jgi:hypothetical protein
VFGGAIFSLSEIRRLSQVLPMVTALMRRQWSNPADVFANRAVGKPELTGQGLDR